jgi:hypothetical protein
MGTIPVTDAWIGLIALFLDRVEGMTKKIYKQCTERGLNRRNHEGYA